MSAKEVLEYLSSVARGEQTESVTTAKGVFDNILVSAKDRITAAKEILKCHPMILCLKHSYARCKPRNVFLNIKPTSWTQTIQMTLRLILTLIFQQRRERMVEVSLKDNVSPAFYSTFWDIHNRKHSNYWLKGGRSSTKSSFISIVIVLGIMQDKDANAIALRKVANILRDSVFEQYLWAIDLLKFNDYWQSSVSPMQLTFRPTGQQIRFKGADDPRKIKSQTFRQGYTKFKHFEEVTEFKGMEVFNNIMTRDITDEEINSFDKIYHGLDFGFAHDPTAYVKIYWESARRRIFIYNEIYQVGLKNRDAVNQIKQLNPLNEPVTADSALNHRK